MYGQIWGRTMGTQVLNVSSTNSSSGGIRSYAHCSSSGTGVTLVLINLDKHDWPSAALELVTADGGGGPSDTLPSTVPASRWLLTGPEGTNSSLVSLNGKVLALDAGGRKLQLPLLAGSQETFTTVGGRLVIPRVPPESVQFIVLEGLGSQAGCE